MTLRPRETFVIARGSWTEFSRVLVEIRHGGRVGRGEAAPSERYGEDGASVARALQRIAPVLGESPLDLDGILARARRLAPGDGAARAALDMALHDLVAQEMGIPVYRLFGLAGPEVPEPTSYTIAMGTPAEMEARARQARDFPVLKVKVGWAGDVAFLRRLRTTTGQRIRVDANEGWTAAEAIDRVAELHASAQVELVEQPCPAGDLDGLARVTEASPVPILADESCVRLVDVPRLAGAVHGINVKLAKCGGLREAWHMIRLAREYDMRVMLGCMVESSLGITAAAHLGAAADYLDLDGNLLLAQDPFRGVVTQGGRLRLPDAAGIGAVPVSGAGAAGGE